MDFTPKPKLCRKVCVMETSAESLFFSIQICSFMEFTTLLFLTTILGHFVTKKLQKKNIFITDLQKKI